MTEERKQELRQLLHEAMGNLIVLYEHRPSRIPIDVYKEYLQERWMYYGVDYLTFSFSSRFSLVIVGENTESKPFDLINRNTKLSNFIEEELDPFFVRDYIPTGSYIVESGFTDGSRLFCPQYVTNQSDHILERLLEIAIVHGIEEAVLVFDRSCCPQGVHVFFQYVALIDGIKTETEIQIFEGVRFVPLPSLKTRKITGEVVRYLPGFPQKAFTDKSNSFFGKTLLVIDCPGFSLFHKNNEKRFESGTQLSDLPFNVRVTDVKYRNLKEIYAYTKSFFQILSLVCNSALRINHLGWFLAEDKSLHALNGVTSRIDPIWERRSFVSSIKIGQTEIEKARCLYALLTNLKPDTLEKLQIPIDRWMKSHTYQNPVDKMIDLGIAFESLYVLGKTQISYQLRHNASQYLGKDKADQETLKAKFKAIYECRCDAVHEGKLDEEVEINGEIISMSEFMVEAQNLCQRSIIKILDDGEFPDWNNLILGEVDN